MNFQRFLRVCARTPVCTHTLKCAPVRSVYSSVPKDGPLFRSAHSLAPQLTGNKQQLTKGRQLRHSSPTLAEGSDLYDKYSNRGVTYYVHPISDYVLGQLSTHSVLRTRDSPSITYARDGSMSVCLDIEMDGLTKGNVERSNLTEEERSAAMLEMGEAGGDLEAMPRSISTEYRKEQRQHVLVLSWGDSKEEYVLHQEEKQAWKTEFSIDKIDEACAKVAEVIHSLKQ